MLPPARPGLLIRAQGRRTSRKSRAQPTGAVERGRPGWLQSSSRETQLVIAIASLTTRSGNKPRARIVTCQVPGLFSNVRRIEPEN